MEMSILSKFQKQAVLKAIKDVASTHYSDQVDAYVKDLLKKVRVL